ncbi:MAG: PEP/pyruvate-binding domain-containing protein [bacterium]
MSDHQDREKQPVDKLLQQLKERAKELNCIYRVEEALAGPGATIGDICIRIIEAIPPGWQYPAVCVGRIKLEGQSYTSPDFKETEWVQCADIRVGHMAIGTVEVFYTKEMPEWDEGPFLQEEVRLIRTIAGRIGNFVAHERMRTISDQWENDQRSGDSVHGSEWRVVLQMLKQTDRSLYTGVSRKMLNHLCWSGIGAADKLMQSFTPDPNGDEASMLDDMNQPHERREVGFSSELCSKTFELAGENIAPDEILRLIQKWIQEDKLSFLVQVVNRNLTLSEVADAIRRYHYLAEDEPDIQSPNKRGIGVSLVRRFLSDQLQYIKVAKEFVEIRDFYELLKSVVFAAESHGKLGGKSAGMYLASQILKKKAIENGLLSNIRIPKTFYVTSDVLLHFMHHNSFDEVVEQKYKPINQVRFEYPNIVQSFKNARFPSDIVNGLSAALDELGDRPLIVRSSSLLEDRIGAAFSGKYKSLFLANQGSKQQRLEALQDAIAEVYASTFGPDPIEYRAERNLLDFGEEMGIMIQEVVGTRVGRYYLPSYAGVAFSRNEFRWSPRIKREDGLVRLVPGLGTRAVDRLSDDYPVLVAPGQPGLRVNATPDETARYSPAQLDAINLDTNGFETVPVRDLIRESEMSFPGLEQIVSIYRDGVLQTPMGMIAADVPSEDLVVTFEGLVSRTTFVKQIQAVLTTLEDTLGMPVDIEFAHDGRHLYLLQCRAQSHSAATAPAPIPKGTPKEKVLFTASKFVSNGLIPNITHIVYVDPEHYASLPDRATMALVGRAVGYLNKVLPKRQFILMGPGRWGSRGDIKLGVSITYSDINNTAALIEIARRKGNYVPDLSFGTHFFQDLVEAEIRYLPLYPDDAQNVFNEDFLARSENILRQVAPDYAQLEETIRLIDVAQATGGQVVRLSMNADLDEAIAVIAPPSAEARPTV